MLRLDTTIFNNSAKDRGEKMDKKILIVDDDPDVLKLVRLSLEIEGFRVIEASEARDAYPKINREKPDLIVLDLMMPNLSGWELCKILKENPMTANIPIVILSAKAQTSDINYGKELGVAAYVTKPFSPVELAEKIKKYCGLEARK